jgi:S1-C subfamily serine protease
LWACEPEEALDLAAIRRSIFKIRVKSVEPRYDQPWLDKSPRASSGSGFYIGQGRILTNAHVAAHGTFITVQQDGSDRVWQASVLAIAHDSDLALLKVNWPQDWQEPAALQFAGLPVLRKSVATVGYPKGGEQLSVTEGVVSRLSFRRYAHPGYDQHLLVQVDSAINPGNSGGPVFQAGQVVGVAFQAYRDAENTGYMIPTPVIRRFLDDAADGEYAGHPEVGIVTLSNSLENPGARRFYGLTDGDGGVKVSFIRPDGYAHGSLQAEDILLGVDGYPIGRDGKILWHGERLDFRVPLDLARHGQAVQLTILRDGERQTVTLKAQPRALRYDPNERYVRRPRYLIYGGLIFSPLTRNYLQTWGRKWYRRAPLFLRYLHRRIIYDPRFNEHEHPVVLIGRLPDGVNSHAEPFVEKVLQTVQGEPVTSLKRLAALLDAATAPAVVLRFFQAGAPLVLARETVSGRHEAILQRYRVQADRWLQVGPDGAVVREGH